MVALKIAFVGEQFSRMTAFKNAASFQNHQMICRKDVAQAVCLGNPGHTHVLDNFGDPFLGGIVKSAGGFIHEQHFGFPHECSCDGKLLALPSRKITGSFADIRVQIEC